MKSGSWMTVKDTIRINASKWPDKIGIKDLYKKYTFRQWNERSCRLANGLKNMGMQKGDRFAVLAYNCVEWMEIYAAAAKGGFICVPIMFRLSPAEMEYNINHSECKLMLIQAGLDPRYNKEYPWIDIVNNMKKNLTSVQHYVSFAVDNPRYEGFTAYEDILSGADTSEPDINLDPDDIWLIMYTGGTTGKAKGVMRSHGSQLSQFLIMLHEHKFNFDDTSLLVMPCCHVNSLNYSFAFTWTGGSVMCCNMTSFDPEDLLKTISDHKITFTSLVPTHYIMLLSLQEEIRKKHDLTTIKKFLISSAPARRDTKIGILNMFPNSKLEEAYGSTEAGLVTVLKSGEQLTKLGSCGREVVGSDIIRFYDEDGRLITEPNKIGELYSRSPMLFEDYWKEPGKKESVMKDGFFTAGDMGYRDEEGYIYLVDRKANMIITGGENVYPSEVENIVSSHPKVMDVAVIGLPHEKWGEQVSAFIVLHEGQNTSEKDIMDFCKGKIAGYKIPKNIYFITEKEMPKSGTGKILHRVLREKYLL